MYCNIEKTSNATSKNTYCNKKKMFCNIKNCVLQCKKLFVATSENMYYNIAKINHET